MRVGFIVDGWAEFDSLEALLKKIASPHDFGPIVKADLQPDAPPGALIRVCREQIRNALIVKRVERALVLLDLDRRVPCARKWILEFQDALNRNLAGELRHGVQCIIKVDRFENWLISDPGGLQTLKKFAISKALVQRIEADADVLNASEILRMAVRAASVRAGKNYDYEKRTDALAILSKADPTKMAQSSRSFRRFLRLLGCPAYARQSLCPAVAGISALRVSVAGSRKANHKMVGRRK